METRIGSVYCMQSKCDNLLHVGGATVTYVRSLDAGSPGTVPVSPHWSRFRYLPKAEQPHRYSCRFLGSHPDGREKSWSFAQVGDVGYSPRCVRPQLTTVSFNRYHTLTSTTEDSAHLVGMLPPRKQTTTGPSTYRHTKACTHGETGRMPQSRSWLL